MNRTNRTSRSSKVGIALALVSGLLLTLLIQGTIVGANRVETFLGATAVQDDENDPDFSTVDDPLDGEYELLPVDDLLIFQTQPANGETESLVDNFLLETDNYAVTTQSKLSAAQSPCYLSSGRQPQQTRVGRFFSEPFDQIVTLHPTAAAQGADCTTPDGTPNMVLRIQDASGAINNATSTLDIAAADAAVAMDDFDQDGFSDLLIMHSGGMRVATAVDVTDLDQGFKFGPETTFNANHAALSDPTTGDFNGDELLDVAWIDQNEKVQFATVCSSDSAASLCANQPDLAVILNPLQSGANDIDVPSSVNNCLAVTGDVALTAGDYRGTDLYGLLTVRVAGSGIDCGYFAYWYEFDADMVLQGGSQKARTQLTAVDEYTVVNVYAQSAALDWFADDEQAVVAFGALDVQAPGHAAEVLRLISFDDDKLAVSSFRNTPGDCPSELCPWINGLALGRFADIPDTQDATTDFNQQVATLRNDNTVGIYTVDPDNDFALSLTSSTLLDAGLDVQERESPLNDFSWMVAGDLQGRSEHLGLPSILRISHHQQPTVILGHPPMHVDFILPDESTAAESAVVNFTVAPNSYYSQYQIDESSSTESSHTHTTSHSFSSSETTTAKFKINVPLTSSISGSTSDSWSKQSSKATSKNDYSYSSNSFTSNTATGFGDELWYTSYDFNVYLYPVLGKTICPADNPDCTPSEEQQQYVQYSGPSSTSSLKVDAPSAEWYQPVHQPGQIFSFPANYDQLSLRYDDMLPLNGTEPTGFFTDQSSQTEFANWSQGSGSSVTTSSTRNHSMETEDSITIGPSKLESLSGDGGKVTQSVDLNHSKGVATQNVTQTALASSTGVGIIKPGSFRQPNLYQYEVLPFLFGQSLPDGTVQDSALDATVQTTGPLRLAFTVDPLSEEAGSWWGGSPYSQYVDVALNHPQRWTKTTSSNVEVMSHLNCLQAGTSTINCVTFNEPEPDDLWNSEFYMMRGLIVTVDTTDGPQRATAESGDEIFLQARVYNYSLRDMDPDSKVYVRFYRQEINGQQFIAGTNVLIEEVTIDPIPGFDAGPAAQDQNWSVATTSFTVGDEMIGKNFIFWVVVWAEDENGDLLAELPAHGLSEIPGALEAIGDVKLEETTIVDQDGSPKTTSFSNNVGYWHHPVFITNTTQSAVNMITAVAHRTLDIENLAVRRDEEATGSIEPGERLLITADLIAGGAPVEGASVLFYELDRDGDPPAFEIESMPHIPERAAYPVSARFRPEFCGSQRIGVLAHGAGGLFANENLTVEVMCEPHFLPVISR